MDIRKATVDQILMELARRDHKLILMFLDSPRNNNGGELHYCNVSVKQSAKALKDALKIVDDMLEGKKPDNVSVFKRVALNGKLVEQVEIEDVSKVLDDPWQPNKVGEYDPWVEKPEPEPESSEEGYDSDGDPWKES